MGVHGIFANGVDPVVIRTIEAASAHTLFTADYDTAVQADVRFDHLVQTSSADGAAGDPASVPPLRRCGLFPMVVPLPYGHLVVTGPIADAAILAGLESSHPFLGFWGSILRARIAATSSSMDQALWKGLLEAGTALAVMGL